MSTFFCAWARTGRPMTPAEVEVALDAIAHHGPDGRGVWCYGAVGMGHLALAETPEMVFERQPASLDARLSDIIPHDVVISADVRLDNRTQLAAQLRIPDDVLPTLGDSQLILAAYLRWGEECVPHLLGDFAFVIWDGPQQKLFCARDALGSKPLYTYIQPDLFLVASDRRALISHPQGPRQPDLSALAYYLREPQFVHPTMTYLAGVVGLLPAHTLTVTADQVMRRRYWFPDRLPQQRVQSFDRAAEELRALLEDAVRVRLRRVQGVGAHMSGGLDSTSVAILAAQQVRASGDAFTTYSWQPTPPDAAALASSEYAPLHTTIEQGGFDHTAVNVTAEDAVREIEQDICRHHTNQFVYEPVVRQAAAARHVRVLLSGWGGDELITAHGGGYLAEMFWRGRWDKVARTILGRPVPEGKSPWRHRLGTFYKNAISGVLPDTIVNWQSSQPHADLPPHVVCTSPELAALIKQLPDLPNTRRRTSVHGHQLTMLHLGHLHQRIEGWAADGADDQIVYRYPLLDQRVVEFALTLPADAYVQGTVGRYLFRRAMSDALPHEVCWGVAKLEPVRVDALLKMMKQALLPAFNATVERLDRPPRIELDLLRDHITSRSLDTKYDMGDLGVTRRAIQVLGAGWQLPKSAASLTSN